MPSRAPPEKGVPQDATSPTPNDPFVFESFIPPPSRHPHLNTSHTLSPNDIPIDEEDFLRPYIHIFRLDPFSTHDGVHGRPVPAAVRARPHPESARPVLLEFQLDLPDQTSAHLSSVGSVEPDEERTKEEDESNPRRLLYLDGQATYFPGTIRSGSTPEDRPSPDSHLLIPQPEPEPECTQLGMTPWSSAALFNPHPRSPSQVHPFSQVGRPSEEAFQPLTLIPTPEQQSLQMRMPVQTFPTSLAYHAEAQGHEHMHPSNTHRSGSYPSTMTDSPLNIPNGGASAEYNYNSFGYDTNGSSGTGYSSGRLPMTPQPPERPSPPEYRNPYALPGSHSSARGTSLQPQREPSFSQSHFPPAQSFQLEPHSRFSTFGNDIPAQPPITNFHETTTNAFPESLALDKSNGLLPHPFSPFTSAKFPNFLAKSIVPSPPSSPEPAHPLLLSSRFSPILETPSRQVTKSPSPFPSRSMTLSPTPSVESTVTGASRWPRRSHTKQRRVDLAPYIPGRMRRQQYGKPKEHWCTVCNKQFKRPSTLSTHMNTHTGEQPYFCPVLSCGRRFSVSSNLTRHLKTHGIKGSTPRGPRAKSNRRNADNERRARNSMAAAATRGPLVERNNATEAWCPESLRGMRNARFLSSRGPFVLPEGMVPPPIPLPPVHPSGNVGDENYEERDSFYYAEGSEALTLYHPGEWRLRPTLPGPSPSAADKEAHARESGGSGAYGYGNGATNLGGVFGHGGGAN